MTRSTFPVYFSKANPRSFREALSRFATGVTVVTLRAGAGKSRKDIGVTISSFAGLSLHPPLILFCLDEKARILPAFKKGSDFAVNILSEEQKPLAKLFSGIGLHGWKKIPLTRKGKGPTFLQDALAILHCKLEKKIRGGDHTIIIGRVKKIALNKDVSRPLLHTQRRYWALGRAKR